MKTKNALALLVATIVAAVSGSLRAADEGQAGQRDLVRVREGPDDDLWLRINAGGHTAAVQTLCFTPDSTRLCSAGLDKTVEVWNLGAVTRDIRRVFLRERTIRWQVARGLRGSIYAMCSAPNDGLLAFGGYGAMGSLGEILLVNPLDGSLSKVLEGHRQTVCSLAFSADGQWLASQDTGGAAILWKRGQWQSTVLYDPDEKTYGPENAALIARQPKLRPIAFAGSGRVVLPVFVGEDKPGRLRWQLAVVDPANTKDFRTLDTIHYGMTSALAASADGARLASADLEGNLYLWDLAAGRAERLETPSPVVSLSFSADGSTLAAGTLVSPSTAESQLQVWDVRSRRIASVRKLPDHVRACTISPDGKRLAYTGGKNNEVFVAPLADPNKTTALSGKGRRILKVAFAKEEPFYRVAFGSDYRDRGFNDYADLQETFDTTRSSLSARYPVTGVRLACRRLVAGRLAGETAGRRNAATVRTAACPKAAWSSIPAWKAGPAAIVGSPIGRANRLPSPSEPTCKTASTSAGWWKRGRVPSCGTSAAITTMSLRWRFPATCGCWPHRSADGTIMFWSLSEFERGPETLGRWGAEFAVRGEGLLLVKSLDPAGPLFRKGLREGDVITAIRWPAEQADRRRSVRRRCWKRCKRCPGARKSSSRSVATAPPGPPSNSCPLGSRWRRCSSPPTANGRSGRPRAITTPR